MVLTREFRLQHEERMSSYLPWYYGIAYELFDLRALVVYPMPINLVVRWSRSLWYRAKYIVNVSWWARELGKAEQQGFERGRRFEQNQIKLGFKRQVLMEIEPLVTNDDQRQMLKDIWEILR